MSSGNAESIFAAVDSAVGYLYQCRVALLWALRRLRLDQSFRLSLETLDDVTFERDGSPPALLQTKHHRAGSANLSDASPDLWKTIRIWSEGLVSGSISTDASLVILTTSLASVGSAAAYLRPEGRDVPMALEHLLATARASAMHAAPKNSPTAAA